MFNSTRLPIRIAQLFTGEQPSSGLDYDLGGILECGERRTISLIWSYGRLSFRYQVATRGILRPGGVRTTQKKDRRLA
ncbi:hypothetical protein XH87_13350 [Bradyrhizobium sp. CCBAU 53415]|nr:hypothetical protein [Bradyrhizobium sp. CCBAU 53415]